MADGDVFDRCVVAVFKLAASAASGIAKLIRKSMNLPGPNAQWLRRLFINCGLYIKPPDKDQEFITPLLIRHRQTANGLVLHLQLPPGMTPQDFDKAGDRLGFALGGKVSCRGTSTPLLMELTVRKTLPPSASTTAGSSHGTG